MKLRTALFWFITQGIVVISYPEERSSQLECVWNLMTHGSAREGKWRGNWRMECVAITLTLPRNVVCPALLTLMRTPRLPAVDWADAPADLNGLVRFGERRTLVSARVLSRFKRTLLRGENLESRKWDWRAGYPFRCSVRRLCLHFICSGARLGWMCDVSAWRRP